MSTHLTVYLAFPGTAREAMELYHSVFGGTLQITTYAQANPTAAPEDWDKIAHGQVVTRSGLAIMGADVATGTPYHPGTPLASLSLMGEDADEIRGYWDALVVGGTVQMPFEPAPWGDVFGLVTDRFGVEWKVNATPSDRLSPAEPVAV